MKLEACCGEAWTAGVEGWMEFEGAAERNAGKFRLTKGRR